MYLGLLTMTIFFMSQLVSMVPGGTTLVLQFHINRVHVFIRHAAKVTRYVHMLTTSGQLTQVLYRGFFSTLRQ